MGTHPTQETKSDGCHHVAIAMQHETGDGEFLKKKEMRGSIICHDHDIDRFIFIILRLPKAPYSVDDNSISSYICITLVSTYIYRIRVIIGLSLAAWAHSLKKVAS